MKNGSTPDEFIGQMVGREAAIKLGNALASIKSSECVLLAGLSDAQKSYLNLSSTLKKVNIATIDHVREALDEIGIRKDATTRCRTDEVHEGLRYALSHGAAIEIDEDAENCSRKIGDGFGLVLIERVPDNAASIVAVNYAASVNASIKVVAPVDRKDQRRLLSLLQAWKDNDDDEARNALFAEVDARLILDEVKNYEFVTFFADGVP